MELPGKVFNVLLGDGSGVDVIFNGEILGRQTKGIIADREQDIIPIHPFLTGDYVHSGIRAGMAYVETRPRGVGEFYQTVELGFGITGLAGKSLFVFPFCLPLFFNGGKIVFQCKHSPVSFGLEWPNRQ